MTHRNPLLDAWRNPTGLLDAPSTHWEQILALSRRYGLAGRWWAVIEQLGGAEALDPDLRDQLRADARFAEHRVGILRWEITCAARALAELEIPVILLKGAAYLVSGIPSAATRLSADLDILVPRDKLNEVEAAFTNNGWISRVDNEYDEAYFRRWMHELPPMQHVNRGTMIDIHHNILPLTSPRCPSAERLFDAAIEVGDGMRTLCPADLVIHTIVHSFYDGEFQNPLRDVIDVHDVTVHFAGRDEHFWQQLVERALVLGFPRPVLQGLRAAEHYCGLPLPASVAAELADAVGRNSLKPVFEWSLSQLMRSNYPPTARQKLAARVLQARSHLHKMPPLTLARHLGYKSWRRAQTRWQQGDSD